MADKWYEVKGVDTRKYSPMGNKYRPDTWKKDAMWGNVDGRGVANITRGRGGSRKSPTPRKKVTA